MLRQCGQAPCGRAPQRQAPGAGSPGAHVGIVAAQGVRLHEELERPHDVRRLLRAERSVSGDPSWRGPGQALRPHRNWPPAATWHREARLPRPPPMGRLRAELTGDAVGPHTPHHLCVLKRDRKERSKRLVPPVGGGEGSASSVRTWGCVVWGLVPSALGVLLQTDGGGKGGRGCTRISSATSRKGS